jgi:hypothetical protein
MPSSAQIAWTSAAVSATVRPGWGEDSQGLQLPTHETRIRGTNLAGDRDYDQVAFVPGLKRNIIEQGMFDFDGILFADI